MENRIFDLNEYDDLEEWEAEADIFYEQDWAGLIEYRRRKAEKYPDSPYDQWALGEAYVLNREYEKAISFLSGLHKKYADDVNIQYSLLAALRALGKDETAVDWIVKPVVLKIDEHTVEYCYNYLRPKRKPRTVYEVYVELYKYGYPMFSDEQLMLFLHLDNRFIFTGSKDKSYDCFIAVKRKSNAKK